MDLIELSDSLDQVALTGRLDTAGVGEVEMRFTATLSGSGKDAIVDISEVEFCGSLAIRMLLSTARVMQRRGRRMVIAGAQPQVLEVFETVALGTIIPLSPDATAARGLLGA